MPVTADSRLLSSAGVARMVFCSVSRGERIEKIAGHQVFLCVLAVLNQRRDVGLALIG